MAPGKSADSPLMLPGEAGQALRVDAKTIGRWAVQGLIWSTRTPGGQIRVSRSQILAIARGDEKPWGTP